MEEEGLMGAGLSRYAVAYEMARRKVQFYGDKEWDGINLWGLFSWGEVSKYLGKELFTHMKKENKTIWVTPSKEFWEKEIEPLTKVIRYGPVLDAI